MKIFVTGGAGYIGSHIIKNLLPKNYQTIVLDNLSTGFLEPIEILKKNFGLPAGGLEFIKGDLKDKEKLLEIFQKNKIETVIHLAAKIDVSESVTNPDLYHRENFLNGVNLVEAMLEAGINKMIFSSTAAVYGEPQYTPIDEKHPTNPDNPYGQTKLDFERYLSKVNNLKYIILRYFNVGGADPGGLLGKSHLKSNDLIETIMKVALDQKESLEIYGSDYDTPDGSAIRDFVHVEDITQAHILALKGIEEFSGEVFNLGSDLGFSAREIVDKAKKIIGKNFPVKIGRRREGDIAVSVASSKKAKRILDWKPKYSNLATIIKTDWNWRKEHPWGYKNVKT